MGLRKRIWPGLDSYGGGFRWMGAVPDGKMGVDRRRLCLDLLRTLGVGALSLRKMGLRAFLWMVLGPTCEGSRLLGTRICGLGSHTHSCLLGSSGAKGDLLRLRILWSSQRQYHEYQHTHDQCRKSSL